MQFSHIPLPPSLSFEKLSTPSQSYLFPDPLKYSPPNFQSPFTSECGLEQFTTHLIFTLNSFYGVGTNIYLILTTSLASQLWPADILVKSFFIYISDFWINTLGGGLGLWWQGVLLALFSFPQGQWAGLMPHAFSLHFTWGFSQGRSEAWKIQGPSPALELTQL
jgi:hypothetical protein